MSGKVVKVSGPLVVATGLSDANMSDVVRVGPQRLIGEILTMSVNVPVYDFKTKTQSDSDIYPYGFAGTSGELDTAVDALGKVFRKMLKLAQIEKAAQLMAEEIEKTRRRVNALEYVVIPDTQEAIRYINMVSGDQFPAGADPRQPDAQGGRCCGTYI